MVSFAIYQQEIQWRRKPGSLGIDAGAGFGLLDGCGNGFDSGCGEWSSLSSFSVGGGLAPRLKAACRLAAQAKVVQQLRTRWLGTGAMYEAVGCAGGAGCHHREDAAKHMVAVTVRKGTRYTRATHASSSARCRRACWTWPTRAGSWPGRCCLTKAFAAVIGYKPWLTRTNAG